MEEWYQTVERVINGTFNMQKKYMVAKGLAYDVDKAKQMAEKIETRMSLLSDCLICLVQVSLRLLTPHGHHQCRQFQSTCLLASFSSFSVLACRDIQSSWKTN